jgi:hypothetical protein
MGFTTEEVASLRLASWWAVLVTFTFVAVAMVAGVIPTGVVF